MKSILSIGGHTWLCPDATQAAKVCDALAKLTPLKWVDRDELPEPQTFRLAYVIDTDHEHHCTVEQVDQRSLVLTRKELYALTDKKRRALAAEQPTTKSGKETP